MGNEFNLKHILGGAAGIAVMIIVAVLIFGSWYYIPAGSVGVKFISAGGSQGFDYNELPQGFGFKMPFVVDIDDIPFRTQTIGFYGGTEERGTYGVLTPKDKNGIDFDVDLTIRYRLDPTQAAEFVEQKGYGVEAMEQLMATAARADSTRGVFGQYSQEDVPTYRTEIAVEVKKVLQDRINMEASRNLKKDFIVIEAVDIRSVRFNKKIEDRIIEKQTKLQEAQQKTYELEIAGKNKDIEMINAEKDKQAAVIRAEGEAEAIKTVAFAKAEGLEKVNEAYQNMPNSYVITKIYESINQNDKIIVGLDSLAKEGQNIGIMDYNQLLGSLTKAEKIGQAADSNGH